MLVPRRLSLLGCALAVLAACTSPTADDDAPTVEEEPDAAERDVAAEPGGVEAERDDGGREEAVDEGEGAGEGEGEGDERADAERDDEPAGSGEAGGHDHDAAGHGHAHEDERGADEPDEPEVPEELTAPFDEGRVVLAGDDEAVGLDVYVADTPELRRRGLQGWPRLPERTGMLFVFEEDSTSGFWMKDTLIPLSIAFADADGRIHTFRDMEPCEAEPCPSYEPDAPYRYALEVEQGAFAALGVEPGWVLQIEAAP